MRGFHPLRFARTGPSIGTEFTREMAIAAEAAGWPLPDRELAYALIKSELGQRYLGAMRCAINCALANREIIGCLVRRVLCAFSAHAELPLLFDVSHNTCKAERHEVKGRTCRALCASKRGHARLQPQSSRTCRRTLPVWAAGAYRRKHGHGILYPCRRRR